LKDSNQTIMITILTKINLAIHSVQPALAGIAEAKSGEIQISQNWG
jgi:hypothetical protein